MKSFTGLLKKELIVSKNWLITWLCVLTLLLFSSLIFIIKYGGVHSRSLFYFILFVIVSMHVFFIPIVMYSFLHLEGKTMLWLYNPNSSHKLLLAKLLMATIHLIISMILIGIFAGLGVLFFDLPDFEITVSPSIIIFWIIYFYLSSVTLAVIITFLWTVYHSLSKFPGLKKLRWLAVLLVFIALNLIDYFLFERTQLIENNFFNFAFEIDGEFYFEIEGDKVDLGSIPVHVGTELYYLIKTVLLYIISCLLLDKKVEV
ncbi:hypothetical protein [Pallidibacillus pasinlerensis]|uniref:Uncharacterized protein n=1 Tax=Pallidibacillus pasinlerensis TaxID=2703818 RepID=A0ABX0A854_9BACI|nr:hypothetical protein [Pallidibacillus pasinlerensis]NCU18390.1 hypothetical protein [Pallidibacillus pasinlerensis]